MTEAEQTLLDEIRALREDVALFRERGSQNFRHYRRRATVAFVILSIASAVALFLVVKWNEDSRERFADANRQVTLKSCESGNELRLNIVSFLASFPHVRAAFLGAAREAFAPVDCQARIAPLKNAK